MEDNYEKSGYQKGSTGEEIFIHFHEAQYLTENLNENNFKIIYLDRKTTTMTNGSIVVDLIIIASKET